MVVGHSRSWTPRLRYEAKLLTLPREATTAVTPRGMQDGMSTYAGTVRGVDKGRSAHLWLLGTHLATERAQNVRGGEEAARSRERASARNQRLVFASHRSRFH